MSSNKFKVDFIDTSSEVKKTMEQLSKSALRASAKVVRKHIRDDVPVRTKRIKNHVASWVFIDKKTGQPQAQIGFYGWQRVKKRGKKPSHSSPWWIEQGTKPHVIKAKLGFDLKYGFHHMYDKSKGIDYGLKVQHPGQAATNILRNSVYNNIDEIRAAQEEYLKLLNGELEKAGAKIYNGDEEEDD